MENILSIVVFAIIAIFVIKRGGCCGGSKRYTPKETKGRSCCGGNRGTNNQDK